MSLMYTIGPVSLPPRSAGTCLAWLRLTPLLPLLLFFSCSGPRRNLSRTFFRIDTAVTVTLATPPRNEQALWQEVDSLLHAWQRRFSYAGRDSYIRRVNERHDRRVPVSPLLYDILHTACAYGDTTRGAFDVTIMPLKRLWGLTSSSTHTRDTRSGVTRIDSIPPAPAIARACSAVDYRTITFHPADTALTLHDPRTKIDVGGIAKGYVLQALDRLLGTRGITDFLIDAGGDILVRGRKADGTPWRIGIQHPAGPGLIAAVSLRRGALVTSGDYERFVMIDSIRYGHIIDAHTGMPCRRNRSVSVWSPDPIRADILSTAFFCMSADSILSFVNERDSLHCMVVDSHDIIHVSRGWKEKVTLFSDTTAH